MDKKENTALPDFGELIVKYMPAIRSAVASFPSCYHDDLEQEGRIGLFNAYREYVPEFGPFPPFAKTCIRNRIYSELRRIKDKDMHTTELADGYEPADQTNMEETILTKTAAVETLKKLQAEISDIESEIFGMYLEGFSYAVMADKTGLSIKKIDNTLLKIKNKLKSKSENDIFN